MPPIQKCVQREEVYLLPGKIIVSMEPRQINTLLGSCVAVCLWDERLRIGGMNHYLLPETLVPGERSGRFGNVALRLLVEKMTALGSKPEDLRAKIFGGARILESLHHAEHLGLRNVEQAREGLRDLGIRLVAMDVGGEHGRRLSFFTDEGQAWVKYIEGGSK